MTVTYHQPTWEHPTEGQLMDMAMRFVRDNKPKEYNQLVKQNKLDEYCRSKAKATLNEATNLIATGMYERQAWNQAERIVLLEVNSD